MKNKKLKYQGIDGYIYQTACKYLRAANYIPDHDRGAPYYVNLAFSIELFLKSLNVTTELEFEPSPPFKMVNREMVIHGKIKGFGGHSLLDIFKTLPQEIKDSSEAEYAQTHNVSIYKELDGIKNVFVEWRYLFEKDHICIPHDSINNVASFLKGFVERQMHKQ